nr:polyprotein [Bukalasa bat virus]
MKGKLKNASRGNPAKKKNGNPNRKKGFGLALIMGIMHYATHIAMGMKVNANLKRFWKMTPPGRLAKGLTVLINILRSLLNSVLGRKKRRSGESSWVLVMLFGCLMAMEIVPNGDGWVMQPVPGDVGKTFKVGSGLCVFSSLDIGHPCEETVTYACVTLSAAEEPVDVDCFCRGVDGVEVTYPLCKNSHARMRRDLSIADHPPSVTLTKPTLWKHWNSLNEKLGRSEEWVSNNGIKAALVVGVVVYVCGVSWKSFLLAAVVLMVAPSYATTCVGIQKRDILKGAAETTWFDVLLEKGSCVTITSEDKPTIDLWLEDVQQENLVEAKHYCMKVAISNLKMTARCPTQGEATLAEEVNHDYVCKRGFSDRGWGNGCGLFGKGSIVGCAKAACEAENVIKTHVYDSIKSKYVVAVEVHKGMLMATNSTDRVTKETFSAEAQKHSIDLGPHGTLDFNCRVVASTDLSDIRLLEVDGHYFNVHEDWLDDLPLPWKVPGGYWKNLEQLVVFKEPHAVKMAIQAYGDQRPTLLKSLVRAEEIQKSGTTYHLSGGHVDCRVSTTRLKLLGSTYQVCSGSYEWLRMPTRTQHDTVAMELKYKGERAPCRVSVMVEKENEPGRNYGNLITSNPYVQSKGSSIFLEMEVPMGTSVIKIGQLTYQWKQTGSSIGKAMKLMTRNIEKTLITTSSYWNSNEPWTSFNVMRLLRMPFDMVFGNMSFLSKLVVSVILIWVALNVHNSTIALVCGVVGVGLISLTTGVVGDVGCLIDTSRKEMRCGDGIMVWNEVNNWKDGYRYYPEDPQTFLGSLAAIRTLHCGHMPLNHLELQMWKSLVSEINWFLEEHQQAWRVTVSDTMTFYQKTGNVGWRKVKGNDGISWTNWLKSSWPMQWIVNPGQGSATFFVGDVGLDECPLQNRTWNGFKLAEFGLGLTYTRVFLDMNEEKELYCDVSLLGAAARDKRIVHSSIWLWMDSYEVNGTLQLQYVRTLYVVECLWPLTHTLGGRGTLESMMILPVSYGGPRSALNMIDGYKEQIHGPWMKGPLEMERGFCDGTTVVVTEQCEKRGRSARSTTEGGVIIPEWCCRDCVLPPLKYTLADGCWYAMEIRPMRTIPGVVYAEDGMETAMRSWGLLSLLVLFYMGFFPSLGKGKWSLAASVFVVKMILLGVLDLQDINRYVLALGATYLWQFPEPVLWMMALQVIFALRPGVLIGLVLARSWKFERMLAMVAILFALQWITFEAKGLWEVLDALSLVCYGFMLTKSSWKGHVFLMYVVALERVTEHTLRMALMVAGISLMIISGKKFSESDWVQKSKMVLLGGMKCLGMPYASAAIAFFLGYNVSRRAVDLTSIMGIMLAIGAMVCKNGLETSSWTIGIMGVILLFFLLQISGGEMQAEWAGYHDWKKECGKSTGSLSLEVKRLSDGKLLNMTKDKDDYVELAVIGVGMVATGFHWMGIPATVGALAVKKWFDSSRRSIIVLGLGEATDNDEISDPIDGVYRIFASGLLGRKQVGVGIWRLNTFHTMWHVTRGSVLTVNGRKFSPYWANITEDLISYNGSWKFSKKWDGDEIQVHAYTPDGKVVSTQLLPGNMTLEDGQNLGLIPLDFPPGTSGSPVISKEGEVVGLYGNGVIHGDTYCSSIAQASEVEEIPQPKTIEGDGWMAKGRLTIIDAHPGSGKTHRILPSLVKRCVERKLRTLVLAPTRIVIKEMERALRGLDVSYHSSAVSTKTPGSLVDVMCHATFVTRKLVHMPQKNYEVIIMDEAHWTDPSSIAARGYITSRCEDNRCAVVLMTATPPGVDDPWADSNEKIEDQEKMIPDDQWKQGYEWITEFEGRTAWFVPSYNAAIKISKSLKERGKKTLVLTSKTFHDNYPKIKEEQPDFILTTDISEMGANLDVERVIDPRTTLKPVEKGASVEISGEMQITPASAAQRRGRVGRTKGKKAEYVYQGEVESDDSVLVCWKEAQMLLDNMDSKVRAVSHFYGPEQEKMTETPGFFRLNEERRKMFRHLLTQCDFTPWLAWQVAANTKGIEDRAWVSVGPKNHEVDDENGDTVTFVTPGGRTKKLQPVWLDQRMVKEKGDLVKFLEYAQMKRTGLGVIPGLLYRNVASALDTVYVYYTATPGSRNHKMAIQELPEAVLCLLQALMMVIGIAAIGVWMVTRVKIDRLWIGTTMIMCCAFSAWFGGVPLALVSGVSMFCFVLLVCLIPEEGMQRTQIDSSLATLLLALVVVVMVVVANELRMLENTKRDLAWLISKDDRLNNVVQSVESWISLDIKPMGAWATYVVIVTLLRPQALHNLQMFTQQVISGAVTGKMDVMSMLPKGAAWIRMGFGDLTLAAGVVRNLNLWNLLLGVGLSVCHWMWFYPLHAASESMKAHKILTQSMAKNTVVDGEVIYQFEETPAKTEETEKKFSMVVAMALGIVNSFLVRETWSYLELGMIVMVGLKHFSDPKATTFWTLPVVSGIGSLMRGDHMGVIPILFRLWGHYHPNTRGLSVSHPTLGEHWKKQLNTLSKEEFLSYKKRGVVEVDRAEAIHSLNKGKTNTGHAVSRGTSKLAWMHERGMVELTGEVVDLGCGRGGWSYYAAAQNSVRSVKGYTLGTGGHEKPRLVESLGWNLITFKAKTDVMSLKPMRVDTILCDIGESSSSTEVEAGRTTSVLKMLEAWLDLNPTASFCCKVLCPYHPKVLEKLSTMQIKFGGGLVRVPLSRNSTHEMYFVSGLKSNLVGSVNAVSRKLMRRFDTCERTHFTEDYKFPIGTRSNMCERVPVPYEKVKDRVAKLKREHGATWTFDLNHPYRTWCYHGSYKIREVGTKASSPNYVVKLLSWPWQALETVFAISMTDTTAFGQQRVFKEKVDTKAPEPPEQVKKIMKLVFSWLITHIKKRGGKVRMCTKEEFIQKVETHASIGAWSREMEGWTNAKEAVNDNRFWDMVDKERNLHLQGRCENCVYNLMGKREKKPGEFGVSKGSRTIWYMWLGSRFLEFESFGFLNEEHWASRELCGGGVEGIPLFYLGYHLEKMAQKSGVLYADDTAGWDTRITMSDLEDERLLVESMEGEHKKLAEAIFDQAYKVKVALCPRPGPHGGTVMDVISRTDQRGSGQVVTYALNTLTNIKVQLIRMAEAEGVLGKDLSDNGMSDWLEKVGEDRLERLLVSGDDCVVNAIDERFSTSLVWLNSMEKVRKDVGLYDPSTPHRNWEKVEFCSNHFHRLFMKDGRSIVVPCRNQNELIGRASVNQGGSGGVQSSACLAKAYSQMWLLMYFHRRDLRLLGLAIMSAVPARWIPVGRTTWSIHATKDWMTTEDMLDVWNRVWIEENPWMDEKHRVSAWRDVPYLRRGFDIGCGSLVGTDRRAKWSKLITGAVLKVRRMMGSEHFLDYLSAMDRYAVTTTDFALY